MQHLKSARFTRVDRQRSGVTAHKVIEVKGNNIIIGVPPVLSKDGKISLVMSDTSDIKPGIFLDFQFAYTISNGQATSYRAKFLGATPPEFSPQNGETYTK